MGIALCAIVLYMPKAPREKIEWLSAEEWAQAQVPGPLDRLKFFLMGSRLTGPLLARLMPQSDVVMFQVTYLKTRGDQLQAINLSHPDSVRADGLRGWILSAEALKQFQPTVTSSASKAEVAMQCAVASSYGIWSSLFAGDSTRVGGPSIPRAMSVDLCPQRKSGTLALFMRTVLTDPDSGGTGTNLSAACHAVLANGAGLLIEQPGPDAAATNHWVLFTPRISQGKNRKGKV